MDGGKKRRQGKARTQGSMTKPKLTLFDLDHTLLSGDSDVLWCDFLIQRGLLDAASFTAQNAAMEQRYKEGTVGIEEFANFYVGTLRGQSTAFWEPIRKNFLNTCIVPNIPQSALDLVQQHRSTGDLMVLTTATNRYITELTAAYLGFKHLIATETELVEGTFTGRTSGTLNMRQGKVQRLKAWLAARGEKLEAFDTTAYSDSINDLPLLQMATRAVAVDPDARLRAQAVSNGWEVLHLAR